MRKNQDECTKWNAAQLQKALDILAAEQAAGNAHALAVNAADITGWNDDQIKSQCSSPGQLTETGCSGGGGQIWVNVDRSPEAISSTIVHEQQHLNGAGTPKGLENCARRRSSLYVKAMTPAHQSAATSGPYPAITAMAGSSKVCGF